jgi:predicted unusual protein kinase regulating ubiquinone biosynthesis (AarF/ABC1/UbiB family)
MARYAYWVTVERTLFMTKQKKFISGRGARFFRITSLTARVSSSYTGQWLKGLFANAEDADRSRSQAHIRNAERVVKTLGELKGAVMKVGQYVSIQADLLPKEFAEILSSLQKAAPPVDYALISSQIESEMGAPPEKLFAWVDEEPHASASIGQVHRARLKDGTEVVVKVQYPDVDRNLEGDLKNLKTLLATGGFLGYRRKDLNEIFEEIRDRLNEELDYFQEAENLVAFRRLFQRDRRILVPKIHRRFSSRRILTMEYVPGDDLEALLSPPYTQEDRDRFGQLIFDIYARQLFQLGIIHADPHPGNFAFRRDGRLIIYDFGCLKHVPPYIQKAYRDAVVCALQGDYQGIDEAMLKLGSRDPKKEHPGTDFYRRYAEVLKEPFCSEEPYDFGTTKIHEKLIELAPLGISKMLHFKPPREIVFISRTIGGHYGNLKRIKARGRWLEILRPYLDE